MRGVEPLLDTSLAIFFSYEKGYCALKHETRHFNWIGLGLLFFLACAARSAPLLELGEDDIFIAPDEINQQETIPLLRRAAPSEGIHFAVGSERAFIGAAIDPGATGLLAVDRNPNVVIYNRMNTVLLRVAVDRRDYLRLRLQANRSEILQRLSSEADRNLFCEAHYSWWRERLRARGFTPLHGFGTWSPDTPRHAFRGANYLREETLFGRLSKMAKADRIRAELLDLSADESLDEIGRFLANEPISVADMSNLKSFSYLTSPRWDALLSTIFDHRGANTVLLVNEYHRAYFYRAIPLRGHSDATLLAGLAEADSDTDNRIVFPEGSIRVGSGDSTALCGGLLKRWTNSWFASLFFQTRQSRTR